MIYAWIVGYLYIYWHEIDMHGNYDWLVKHGQGIGRT